VERRVRQHILPHIIFICTLTITQLMWFTSVYFNLYEWGHNASYFFLYVLNAFSSGASCETAYSTSHNFYIIFNLFLSSICMSLKYCSLDVKQLSINQLVYFTWRNELVAMETWLMISIWSKIDPFSYIYLREVSVPTDVRKRQSMIKTLVWKKNWHFNPLSTYEVVHKISYITF
jgi:hypothetical protein